MVLTSIEKWYRYYYERGRHDKGEDIAGFQ